MNNNSSRRSPDKMPPYIARQYVLGNMITYSLESELTGIIPIGIPTGAGKTHLSNKKIKEIMCSSADPATGYYCAAPKRKWIVFVTPERNNRNTFAEQLVKDIKEDFELAEDKRTKLADSVICLESSIDNIASAVATYGTTCPLLTHKAFNEDKSREQIDGYWKALAHKVQIINNVPQNLTNRGELDSLSKEVSETESLLRNLVCNILRARQFQYKKATNDPDLMAVIEALWPSAKLARLSSAVIVLTPQKLLYPIDTIVGVKGFGRRINLTSSAFAKHAIYMLDEFDKEYEDWLSTYIKNGIHADEIQLACSIRDRLINQTTHIDPLLMGDISAWQIVKEDSDKHGYDREFDEEEVRALADSYKLTANALSEIYSELDLAYMFKTAPELDSAELRGIRGLLNYDAPTFKPVGSKKALPLVIEFNCNSQRNIVKPSETSSENSLQITLKRVHGVITEIVCHHLIRAAKLYRHFYPHFDTHEAISNAVHMTGLSKADCRTWIAYCWNMLLERRTANSGTFSSGQANIKDLSLYFTGCRYLELEDSYLHRNVTYFYSNGIENLPEARLALMASKAPIFAISATWNAPTIKNWDIKYLQRVCNAMAQNSHLETCQKRVKGLSRLDNKIASKSYELSILPSQNWGNIASAQNADELTKILLALSLAPGTTKNIAITLANHIPLQLDEDNFRLARISKLLNAATHFLRGVAKGKHHAMVCLSTKYLGDDGEESAATREALELIGQEILGNKFEGRLVYSAKAKDWKEKIDEFHVCLQSGRPAILLASYPSAGFSKNLQYECPESLLEKTTVVERGFSEVSNKVDIDYLYLASPTNRLSSKIREEDDEYNESAIKGLVQFRKSAEFGEISSHEAWLRTENYLRNTACGAKVTDLPSHAVEGARIVAQGIGRISRTSRKFKHVTIAYDSSIAFTCDFNFLYRLPIGHELETFIEHVTLLNTSAEEPSSLSTTERYNHLAALANRRSKTNQLRLLSRLMRDNPPEDALDAFDAERDALLKQGIAINPKLVESNPLLRQTLVELPHTGNGYAYRQNADYSDVDIAIPHNEESLDEALNRLKRATKSKGGIYGVVCVKKAQEQLDKLTTCPIVKEHFIAKDYPIKFHSGTYFPTPYIYNSIIKGTWGEEAGFAILSKLLYGRFELTRGNATQAERAGDYLVLNPEGASTDVWIDFKNYELAFNFDKSPAEVTQKFKEKAAKVNAKGIIVVNLVDSQNARATSAVINPGLASEPRIVSLSCLLDGPNVDLKAINFIASEIEGISHNG